MHHALPKEDNLKNEDNLKREDDLKNEDDTKNEHSLKNIVWKKLLMTGTAILKNGNANSCVGRKKNSDKDLF